MRIPALFAAMTLVVLGFGTAQASEWVSLGKSDDGTRETFVDVSSIEAVIEVTGRIRRAWIETLFESHTHQGIGKDAGKWIHHWFTREAFNCNARTVRSETTTVFYEDGTISSGLRNLGAWDPVPRDTHLDKEARMVCAWKPK